ncbi:AzlC family ABC transporter permease [Clostridium estertheticum]|uniref:AzlC family ABC transporter permease n=1 Tax=Clostridium estertheticum TaxID=238834 RepID=UPI001C7D0E49|nr:AzlC family ABC transporter permease [Clostridium estertheticum]MBX4262914.1 AzlC family ABC transporter permease [Clostridium estertheticum]WLC70888.1 AzlC family ABC transporter permease [Clostridium estertheticum]
MKEFRFAFKQTVPILFTYLFIGIAYGIMMEKSGYSMIWSFISALFIFAGSMQIVMIPLMHAGTSLLTVAVMTFFINARHLFYGIGFIEKFRKMGWKYPYMVLTLTDETYSVLCSVKYKDGLDEEKATFFIALLDHCYWIAGCTLGGIAGQFLTLDMKGIEFSATAFFTVVVVNHWNQYPSKIPIFAGAISSILFYILLGADHFLVPSLSVSLIALLMLKDRVITKTGGVMHVN